MTEYKIKPSEFIDELGEKGIKLWTCEGKLKYSAPQGAMTSDIIQRLKENKAQIIEELAKRSGDIKIIADPEHRYDRFPLSEIQGAYLMGRTKNMEYGGVACHIYMDFVYPHLDRARAEEAWNKVISDNDTLHSVISKEGYQKVLKEWDRFTVEEHDFSDMDAYKAERYIDDVKQIMGNEMFDTGTYPLFKVALSKCSDKTVMHFSIDVLIADWTSIWMMLNEFEHYYYEPEHEPKDIGVTFRDYITAYQKITDTDKYIRAKKFWQDKIAQLPPAPQLPVNSKEVYEFERYNTVMPADKWQKLKENAADAGVTPVAVLVTAYGSILERYSTNKNFSLNLTTLNRIPIHENVGSIIGDFTSISLLSTDFTGVCTFAQRAMTVNKTLFEVLDNLDYSGIEVLREKARLNGGEKCLMPYVFTSAVGLINTDKGGMKGVYRSGITQTPQVFIDCQVMDGDFGLQVNWDVRKGIFTDGMIEKMFALFEERINVLADDKDAWNHSSLADVKENISVNENRSDLPKHLLHSKILEAALKYPDKLAVADGVEEWDYQQLMLKSSSIVKAIRERNISAQSNIAIVMPKSAWQVAAAVAILSENCVYVPIDSGNAVKRLELIVKNAQIDYIFAHSECPVNVEGAEVIYVDKLQQVNENLLKADGDINSNAYIIHTSGSTGVPKGVVITHKGAVNTIEDINKRYSVDNTDSVIGLSQLNFDLSVYDIFGILSVGGSLIYPDAKKYANPSHWAELINKYKITVWNSVPAFAQMLISYLDSKEGVKFDEFKAVLLSGDWIPLTLPDKIISYMPNVKIACMGGATEASIWSNVHDYKGLSDEWSSIPYGKALSNQEMYVLDSNLNICPIGVAGEIYIAGDGLAVGYLNDKEKTNDSFIIHPDWNKRIYRTGDAGKYFSNREIEFLGRLDSQVKIRGHRIELGEIESCFNEIDGVKQAIAEVYSDNSTKKLVLFVVSDRAFSSDELSDHAKEYLPEYMIPESYEFVQNIPLTVNGKVDHKQLLEHISQKVGGEISSKTVGDLTQTEIKISETVKKALNIDSVDIDVNLYEYGANSLIMAQLAGNLAQMLDSEDAFDSILVRLFENPTIRSAAELIDEINGV